MQSRRPRKRERDQGNKDGPARFSIVDELVSNSCYTRVLSLSLPLISFPTGGCVKQLMMIYSCSIKKKNEREREERGGEGHRCIAAFVSPDDMQLTTRGERKKGNVTILAKCDIFHRLHCILCKSESREAGGWMGDDKARRGTDSLQHWRKALLSTLFASIDWKRDTRELIDS